MRATEAQEWGYPPPMLRLHAIEVRGYRAFAGWSRLELRPLTLIYGRNNAGKSSLLRLLAILADSVGDDTRSALELNGDAGRRGKFKDLPWMGDGVPRSAFRLRLCWKEAGEPSFTDELELAWSDELSRAYVRELRIRGPNGDLLLEARAMPHPDEEQYLTSDDNDESTEIQWTGLRPTVIRGAEAAHERALHGFAARMKTLRRSVTWLDSNRPRPDKLVQDKEAPPSLAHDGLNALEFLAADRELLRGVRAWFARSPVERDLRFKPAGEGYLSPILGAANTSAEFHLLDAGEGMAHVLPVIVGTELASSSSGYRVLAIEEPESHLHGDTQRSLALRLAEVAAGGDPPVLLLETHSRTLLLGIQLAIAKGVLSAERAQVLWCDQASTGVSTLRRIPFTAEGGLVGWPRPALSEESELVRELLDAQDEHTEEPA